ncbi:ROK family transcriptional regulator [Microlunatus ginsengisoli]|uniref:ROK family transcriptional regulator n=1 Tax=Microlunatus ginsengisoli TaxID=363863 RepID=A0ABP6ZD49_9ACTN
MIELEQVPLASLDLLRQITDRHVIDQLLTEPTLTRAEIAARTGISKPTISESVRRLVEAGLLAEAGQQQSGRRGRAGVGYTLRDDLGIAVALSAGPDGLIAETLDVRGQVLRRVQRETSAPVAAAQLDPLLSDLVDDALVEPPGRVRAAALSVAGPVDRASGRLVHLPDSPFLVDELDPRRLLGDRLGPELVVDNDVNWAALAEHHSGAAGDLADFCYCHLGHGLGGAVVRDGEIVRGSEGLAGEIAHVLTAGPGGRTMRLVECFGALDLLQAGSAAIDVDRVSDVLTGRTVASRRRRDAIVEAVAGVIGSISALLDPAGIVVGGPWSAAADLVDRLAQRVGEVSVIALPVRLAALGEEAPLHGARLAAVRDARNSLVGPLAREIAG